MSQKILQTSPCDLDITKDTGQQTGPQSFIRMYRNNCCSSVWVLKETVATSGSDFFKTNSLQGYDEDLA